MDHYICFAFLGAGSPDELAERFTPAAAARSAFFISSDMVAAVAEKGYTICLAEKAMF